MIENFTSSASTQRDGNSTHWHQKQPRLLLLLRRTSKRGAKTPKNEQNLKTIVKFLETN